MAQTKSTEELLRWLYKEFDLTQEDVFIDKHFKILTRQAIDKILKKSEISVRYEPVCLSIDYCVIKAYACTKDGRSVETFGSAEKANVKNSGKYFAEMAEKRAKSRAVLMLAGLYDEGIYGEEESDDFKEALKNRRSPQKTQAKIEAPVKPMNEDFNIHFKDCNTIEELTKAFSSKPELKTNNAFIAAATARRIDIQSKKAA